MVTASDRSVVNFCLSGGEKHDSPEGTALHEKTNRSEETVYLIMDRAYEGDAVRETAVRLGYIPVVPPKKNRKDPWEYDKKLYKQRNEMERFFLRLKRFRRVFSRYDKLDVVFTGFIFLALIFDAI